MNQEMSALDRRSFFCNSLTLGVTGTLFTATAESHKIHRSAKIVVPQIAAHYVEADRVKIFYREAGPKDAPTLLLLHGFPSSSFQYRELMSLLADKYHVIAPDLPGFGFTEVSVLRDYQYTFYNLAKTIDAFVEALNLARYALYVFDYGAPIGFRLALAHPERVTAIISQNGNAYVEGLGDAWLPIQRYWHDPSETNRNALRVAFTPDAIKEQYVTTPRPDLVKPEGYTLDSALISRSGNIDIQLDLFLDYRNNVTLYPEFQRYFREHKPNTLVVWGNADPLFIPAGARAFARDNPNATVHLIDAGHFALETDVVTVAQFVREFLAS